MRVTMKHKFGAALLLWLPALAPARSASGAPPAPAFTHTRAKDWINSPPLTLRDLRGHVVLVDFWTFGCWNCYRSFPWLRRVEAKFKPRGLVIIGVHSPEFANERVRAKSCARSRSSSWPIRS